jgi:hypothetical protein
MNHPDDEQELIQYFLQSEESSFKVTNYFKIYAELFKHLRGTNCTFIETGVLNGGSLFMWRKWLGDNARIIGIDLNPAAKKWEQYGFEIYIGDQGDPEFWKNTFNSIGNFDVLLDDGGHQSFQQIVTVSEALKAAKNKCIIAVEDTITSFMKEFSAHREHSFLEYVKASTDSLLIKTDHFYPGEFPVVQNQKIVDLFSLIYSVRFFTGLVSYHVDPDIKDRPSLVWNKTPIESISDFRYHGLSSARVDWPDPFTDKSIIVKG